MTKPDDDFVTLYADVTKLTPKAVCISRDGQSVWIPLRFVCDLAQARVGNTQIDVPVWVARWKRVPLSDDVP